MGVFVVEVALGIASPATPACKWQTRLVYGDRRLFCCRPLTVYLQRGCKPMGLDLRRWYREGGARTVRQQPGKESVGFGVWGMGDGGGVVLGVWIVPAAMPPTRRELSGWVHRCRSIFPAGSHAFAI